VNPDFDTLVGDDATPDELAALRHVHELLLSATPAPELPRRLARPPRIRRRAPRLPIGRVRATLALAAATLVGIALGSGLSLDHGGRDQTRVALAMHGVGPLAAASALIEVGQRSPRGKWPLEMSVRGLPPPPGNARYELYLTRKGEPDALCGTFRTRQAGLTRVRLDAPGDLDEYTGWIVTSGIPGRHTRVLLTT